MSAEPLPGRPAVGATEPGPGLAEVEWALLAAEDAPRPAERFVAAHRAALRVAALVLAARRPRLHGHPGVWAVLARVEPVLGEWAAYFAALQLTCRAVEAGAAGVVSERMADDLVRDARAFRDAASFVLDRGGGRRG